MNDRNAQDYNGDLKMLFEPDELAAYEYRKTSERKTFFEPERRLVYAVLEDAVLCFQRFINATSKKEKQLYQEAAAWIFEREDKGIFSFASICDICGFDPDFLRMGLRRRREQKRLSGASGKAIAQLSQRAPRQLKLHGYRRGDRASLRTRGAVFLTARLRYNKDDARTKDKGVEFLPS
jgi:hypothetical protein